MQIKVYPRLAIALSRRVRQLAHQALGRIAVVSAKRLAKQHARNSWPLVGRTSRWRQIRERSAQEALHKAFATPEKRSALLKAYNGPLLEFCEDVVLQENAKTLSDERDN
ncbi:hypothetical protein MRB53_038497 [Persea americana]|nr:hypothetical protein MRB53_038497 [Persea americana]